MYDFVELQEKYFLARIQFCPAGVTYREHAELEKAKIGDYVFFEPEPDNPYDSNAIKVMVSAEHEDIHIGYIPKEINQKYKNLEHNYYGEVAEITTSRNGKPIPLVYLLSKNDEVKNNWAEDVAKLVKNYRMNKQDA